MTSAAAGCREEVRGRRRPAGPIRREDGTAVIKCGGFFVRGALVSGMFKVFSRFGMRIVSVDGRM